MALLQTAGTLARADAKSFRQHRFRVPGDVAALRISFRYERGGELPHSLVTLQLFDPGGFRGAGHRFAPRQSIELDARRATPGFLRGPIPAGEWIAEVDVHSVVERAGAAPAPYALLVEAVAESASGVALEEARPAAWVGATAEAAARPHDTRWLRGELHLHSEHSDGRWTTAEMADRARGRGLDFLFLTDHNTTSGVEILRAQLGAAIPVHPGIELTTYWGHALALGASRWIDWRTGLLGRGPDDVARSVRDAGALFVVAHPDAPPDDVCTGCRWTYPDFDPALAHAVEVWGGLWDGPEERNQGCLDLWRDWLNQGRCLAATGATDAHRPEDWEGAVPLTYVDAADASLASILDALREGRSYVSSGPVLEIRALGDDGVLAQVGGTASRPALRAIEALGSAAPAAELRLVANGETLARCRIDGEGRLSASPRASDTWCCAELWSERGDVLLAVTSPIYLR